MAVHRAYPGTPQETPRTVGLDNTHEVLAQTTAPVKIGLAHRKWIPLAEDQLILLVQPLGACSEQHHLQVDQVGSSNRQDQH